MAKKARTIKGVFFDPDKQIATVESVSHEDYRDFLRLIECDTMDIATRKFGEHWLDVVCDDDGLLRDPLPRPSIATFDGKGRLVETIVGKVFVCKSDDEGESVSLAEDEINAVLRSCRIAETRDGKEIVLLTCSCE